MRDGVKFSRCSRQPLADPMCGCLLWNAGPCRLSRSMYVQSSCIPSSVGQDLVVLHVPCLFDWHRIAEYASCCEAVISEAKCCLALQLHVQRMRFRLHSEHKCTFWNHPIRSSRLVYASFFLSNTSLKPQRQSHSSHSFPRQRCGAVSGYLACM